MKHQIVFDYETNNLDVMQPQFVCVSYKIGDEPVRFSYKLDDVRPYLESPDYLKIFHNAMYEVGVSKSLGIKICPPIGDTMVLSWILNMGVPYKGTDGQIEFKYGLKELEKQYFNRDRLDIMQICKQYPIRYEVGKFKKDGTTKLKKRDSLPSEIPEGVLKEYNMADVQGTYDLYQLMFSKMDVDDIKSYQLKCDMILVFEQIQRNGILLDVEYLKEYQKDLTLQIDEMSDLLNNYLPHPQKEQTVI